LGSGILDLFYAAPAPCKNFYVAPAAPAPAPTLLYSKPKFVLMNKSKRKVGHSFFFWLCVMQIVVNKNRNNNKIMQFVPFFYDYPC
jgi:hypothetical protein